MLSLDTRMVGLHVHPDSELAPTRSASSNPLLMMSGYSPITPVNLKAAFDYEASILSESAMLRIDSHGAYDQARRASSDDSLDLDFGTNDQLLPALSTGDSCSDAHSPATSWTDDSLARTSPDPPAHQVAPLQWDQFGFAAPLLEDAVELAETGSSAAGRPSQQHHGLYPDRSKSIFGGLDQKPLASIKVSATNLTCSASNTPVIASVPLEAPFGTTTTHSAPGQTTYSSAGTGEMAASPADRAVPFSYAPLPTEGLVGHVGGGRHVSSTGLPPASVYQNSVPAAGTAHIYDQRQHQLAYPYPGPDVGVLSVNHDHSPLYQLADPHMQSVLPHQQQHQLYLQPQQQQGYHVGAAQGFVPVQFTTVTGVTYAVALPVAATPQAAAIETPHGTYFFVPSTQPQNLAPSASAQPPNVPLGMLATPPPMHEASLPVPPECPSSLPPPPISLNLNAEKVGEPCAHAAPAKRRSSPRSTKSHTAKAANKTRGESVQLEAPLREVEKQQDRVGPAKSSSFQLPQGPSAAAIAAENAAKAAALVAAFGSAHKIRLPVGQGKRGSTKRKHESPSKKARFTCPHPGCGRGFARNFNMQSHYKSHLGVREYDCLWCNKNFSRRHDRARHCVAVHDAVVDSEGTITGPYLVLERNTGKTSIKVEDDVMYRDGGEGDDVDVDAEGDYNLDHHHHLADAAGLPGSPEERDPGEHRQSASASPYWG